MPRLRSLLVLLAGLCGCATSGGQGTFTDDDAGTMPAVDASQGSDASDAPRDAAATDASDAASLPDSPPPPSDAGDAGDAGPTGCTKATAISTCGLSPQCGCPSTQSCDIVDYTTGDAKCIVAGTQGLGRACPSVGSSSCQPGLTCIFGACRPYCPTAGIACVGAGLGKCMQVQDINSKDIPNFKVCAIACDLADANACGGCSAGYCAGCVPNGQSGGTDCEKVGTATQGQTCSGTSDPPLCSPGFACVSSGGTKTCARWCKYPGGACPTGSCSALNPPRIVDGQNYGICP